MSVFARLGGDIYTKAAEVSDGPVGKGEPGIPENDSRNPAVIADKEGDNAGDDAVIGPRLFES